MVEEAETGMVMEVLVVLDKVDDDADPVLLLNKVAEPVTVAFESVALGEALPGSRVLTAVAADTVSEVTVMADTVADVAMVVDTVAGVAATDPEHAGSPVSL